MKKDKKQHILDVAERLCAEVGPREVQHGEIARALGIKPPSLYAHYPSIDAILAATYTRAVKALLATFEGISESEDPIAALNLSQDRQIDLLLERPGIARLVLADLSQPGGLAAIGAATGEVAAFKEKERSLFARAVDAGQLPNADFGLWYSARMGQMYVVLSCEWFQREQITSRRRDEIKAFLRISAQAPLS